MLSEGETAPTFTAPLANGDIGSFSLEDELEDGPVVLAFFPGAFTSVCSHEMSALEERLETLEDSGATLYGVSVDSPFALNEFREKLSLSFALVSDADREVIEEYGISMDFDHLGIHDLAKRAVFVVDTDGTVTYAWVSDDPGVEPDYEQLKTAVESLA